MGSARQSLECLISWSRYFICSSGTKHTGPQHLALKPLGTPHFALIIRTPFFIYINAMFLLSSPFFGFCLYSTRRYIAGSGSGKLYRTSSKPGFSSCALEIRRRKNNFPGELVILPLFVVRYSFLNSPIFFVPYATSGAPEASKSLALIALESSPSAATVLVSSILAFHSSSSSGVRIAFGFVMRG